MVNKTIILVLWGVVGLAIGSKFAGLGITTPRATFSPGHSALAWSGTPCSCGPHSTCRWSKDRKTKLCACIPGYIGEPPLCRPSPEFYDLCFKDNPCGLYAECEVENNTRTCPSCVYPNEGTPPNCHPPRQCDNEIKCGPHSECNPHYHSPCSCIHGFVGEPPNCTTGPALLALCDPYPCGSYSNCSIQDGRPACSCLEGYEGTPPECAPKPDMWRECLKDRPCGRHAECKMVERGAVCSPCDEGFTGQPPLCNQIPSSPKEEKVRTARSAAVAMRIVDENIYCYIGATFLTFFLRQKKNIY